MKKADAPAQPTVPTPEISGQEFLRSAYEQGRRDCYDELVGRVVAALGLELVRRSAAIAAYFGVRDFFKVRLISDRYQEIHYTEE